MAETTIGAAEAPAVPLPEASAPGPETDLEDSDGIEQLVSEMRQLGDTWSAVMIHERADAIGETLSRYLRASDVPELKVKSGPLGGAGGQFDFRVWTIRIDESLVQSPTIDLAQLARLINVVAHEARHAEQWWLIARHLGEEGMGPDRISTETGMPESICDAAAAGSSKLSDTEKRRARTYRDSVYGERSTRRNQVFRDLAASHGALQQATAELEAIDPGAPVTEKLVKALEDARARHRAAWQDYRDLPEEADAWAVGDKAQQAFENASKAPLAHPDAATQPVPTETRKAGSHGAPNPGALSERDGALASVERKGPLRSSDRTEPPAGATGSELARGAGRSGRS